MRKVITFVFLALALLGAGVGVYALLQPNPRGDYVTGMAHLFISIIGAGFAVFMGLLFALLSFTNIKTVWVLAGAAAFVGLAWATLMLI